MPQAKSTIYVGFRHYFIGGLLTPIIFGVIANIILGLVFPNTWTYTSTMIFLVGIIIGVMYSAKYLKKNFLITNSDMVINYSIMWFIVIQVLFILLPYLLAPIAPLLYLISAYNNELSLTTHVFTVVIEIILFYFVSRKYITKNN